MNSLFRNPEVRSTTYKFLILQIILIITFICFSTYEFKQINKSYINVNIATAGKILEKNPELEKYIAGYFTKAPTSEEIKKGRDVLSKYGYKEDLNLYNHKILEDLYKNFTLQGLIVIIFCGFLMFLFIIIDYKKIFDKLSFLASEAEKIIGGNFNINISENSEGDFYILSHQFNEMAKRLKQSIEVLNKEKIFLKNIISDISHQLKTPLSSLIMFNEIIANNKNLNEEDKKNFIQESSKQLSKMEWLIINLLKIARLEVGAIEFDIKENLLLKTVENSVSSLKIKAEKKRQTIDIKIDKDITFKHDVNWTAEALSNIVKNAIEHTKEGGKIEIEAEETPLSIQIKIKDNGEGIKKEDLPRIFDRFYKCKNSLNPESIGIGLSLSKAIIDSQGGSIGVISKQGAGTEFMITFLKGII